MLPKDTGYDNLQHEKRLKSVFENRQQKFQKIMMKRPKAVSAGREGERH